MGLVGEIGQIVVQGREISWRVVCFRGGLFRCIVAFGTMFNFFLHFLINYFVFKNF